MSSAAHPVEQRQTGDAKYLLSDQQKKAGRDLFSKLYRNQHMLFG